MIDTVPAAEARAGLAQARLAATLATLKARLAPRALAQDAVDTVVEKSLAAAQDGIDIAKRNPLPIAGAVAAIALLLTRRPIARLLHRFESDATPAPPASLSSNRRSAVKNAVARRKSA